MSSQGLGLTLILNFQNLIDQTIKESSIIFQVQHCCFFGAKSFTAPMLTCCQIDPHVPTSAEFESGKHCLSRKPIRKCRKKNACHFETGLNVLNLVVHHCNRLFGICEGVYLQLHVILSNSLFWLHKVIVVLGQFDYDIDAIANWNLIRKPMRWKLKT